jgi:hypothetical protein
MVAKRMDREGNLAVVAVRGVWLGQREAGAGGVMGEEQGDTCVKEIRLTVGRFLSCSWLLDAEWILAGSLSVRGCPLIVFLFS